MASSYNDEIAFIHVPKTGGSWAMRALRVGGVDCTDMGAGPDSHVPWSGLPSDCFRFGFVRHPVTWYRSWWSYMQRYPEEAMKAGPFERQAALLPFAEFVRWATDESPGWVHSVFTHFLGPPGAIEFTGRYERLVDDLIHALTLAGVDFDQAAIRNLPPLNVSEDRPEIDNDSRLRIVSAEFATIEAFGYEYQEVG